MAHQFPPFVKSVTTTVEDIYGTSDLVYPDGYEPTGEFRIPNNTTDIFLSATPMWRHVPQIGGRLLESPYIILRKKKIQYTAEQTLNFLLNEMRSGAAGYVFIDSLLGRERRVSNSPNHLKEMIEDKMREKGIK